MYNHPLSKYLRLDRMPHIFCPGCGCGQIMNSMLTAIDELELDINKTVFIGGVGCNARQICWVKGYAMHGLHGRELAWATGVKLSAPELNVIVTTGDGILAIGGNHLIHVARRNIDLTLIVSTNFNYGSTGGQFTPTTPLGTTTTSSPSGSIERPFDFYELVKAAGATFFSRWASFQYKQLRKSFKKAILHKGFSVIEVLSPCPINYGRRVLKTADPLVTLKKIEEMIITPKKASELSPEELKGKFIVGDFFQIERSTYYDDYQRYIERERKAFQK